MKQPRLPITLSPQGHLHLDETVVGGLQPRLARGLRDAAGQYSAQVLLVLTTHGLWAALPPAGAFWRELGRRYFTKLCHAPELAAVTVIGAPPAEELQALADGAPPMVGAEYLRVETLTRLWGELDAAALGAMRAEAGGAAAWLAAQNPLWRQEGRVTFHLAENKRDAERPFAFLATYTHRLSEQAPRLAAGAMAGAGAMGTAELADVFGIEIEDAAAVAAPFAPLAVAKPARAGGKKTVSRMPR